MYKIKKKISIRIIIEILFTFINCFISNSKNKMIKLKWNEPYAMVTVSLMKTNDTVWCSTALNSSPMPGVKCHVFWVNIPNQMGPSSQVTHSSNN